MVLYFIFLCHAALETPHAHRAQISGNKFYNVHDEGVWRNCDHGPLADEVVHIVRPDIRCVVLGVYLGNLCACVLGLLRSFFWGVMSLSGA